MSGAGALYLWNGPCSCVCLQASLPPYTTDQHVVANACPLLLPLSNLQAAPDATGLGCNVSVHVTVPFNKRCMVKGLITNTTYKDCQVRSSTQQPEMDCRQHLAGSDSTAKWLL